MCLAMLSRAGSHPAEPATSPKASRATVRRSTVDITLGTIAMWGGKTKAYLASRAADMLFAEAHLDQAELDA